MPSPSSAGTATPVANSSQLIINALLAGMKWGGASGTGVMLTYSFPWAGSGNATFSGPDSQTPYSTDMEYQAATHFGLNTVQQAAAAAALQAWAAVANVTFAPSPDTATVVGDIRFGWASSNDMETAAWAYYPDKVFPNGGDVWINASLASNLNDGWNAGDYNYYTLIHEIGHALGLKHPFDDTPVLSAPFNTRQYTVMSYTDGPYSLYGYITRSGNSQTYHTERIVPDTPMVDDIAAIQYLYGANTAYKTGNDTYTFDPASPFLRTVWDAGGIDTISVSNFTKGCMIDLQPGHYSNITIESASTAGFNWSGTPPAVGYDGTGNLGIAFGCVIENAVGGAGNDFLIGNDAANNLTGGAGDDTLDGGAGLDTASFSGLSTSATITFDAATGQTRITTAAGGADTLTGIEFAAFSDRMVDLRAPAPQSGAITGTAGNDNLLGAGGNDTLAGSAGSDVFDGGAGLDTVNYQGPRSAFTVQVGSGGAITVAKSAGGQDMLAHVERLVFTDGAMAFDTGANGVAGQAYRMYQAAFDRAPDAVGLGFWVAMMDRGVTQQQVSAGFVNSPEFKALYGANPTNEELVTRLYNNVLHRAPEPGGKAFWLDVLDRKLAPVSDVLAAFSESPENREAMALVIGAGFGYQPYTG